MAANLLIPGLLCDATVWQPVLGRMSAKVADLSTQSSIGQMAQDCLDRVSGQLNVAGHSMGARVAIEMVRRAPERIERLVLMDTGVHPLKDGEPEKRGEIVTYAHDHGMEALADRWLPGMVHRQTPELMGRLRDMVVRMDPDLHERQITALVGRPRAAEVLPTITCPVLLIVGRQDQWSPVSQHEEMLDLLSNGRLEIVDNAGHFAPVEQPEQVADLVVNFFQEG